MPAKGHTIESIVKGIRNGQFSAKEIFNECLTSDRHEARVRDDIESGFVLDVDSVPQLFVTAPNGKVFVFRKSPSYAVLNATVLAALELTN